MHIETTRNSFLVPLHHLCAHVFPKAIEKILSTINTVTFPN